MREMGSVDLLTREGEISIAKRIEDGARDLLSACVHYPGVVEGIIEDYKLTKKGEKDFQIDRWLYWMRMKLLRKLLLIKTQTKQTMMLRKKKILE